MYAQLNQSYLWHSMNTNGRVLNVVQELMKVGEQVDFSRMPTALTALRNRAKSPIFGKIQEAIKEERIILLYNPSNKVKAPSFLPFVTMRMGNNRLVAIVFLEFCGAQEGEDKEILADARRLKVSMESSYFTLQMMDSTNSSKLQSASIIRPSSRIYNYIMTECLNRKHSIKMDQTVFNAVSYIITNFFVRTTMGCTSTDEVVESYCVANCKDPNPAIIHRIVDSFSEEDYKDISTVLVKMASHPELTSRLGKLTVANFTESYINMYNSAMLLAAENFPYLVFNILSTMEATYINNYYHLKGIVGDDGKKLYATLLNTIC